MAEIKNNFLQAKMNQDLDSRLLPNGQYREGINIAISKSEGSDVGAIENILGNSLLTNFGIADKNIDCIGSQVDESTNSIYLCLTNYTDTSGDTLSFHAPANAACYIVYYNFTTGEALTLIGGSFLNFSKTQPVQGITILENLLFWTDNRNQPRKINIDIALNSPFNNPNPYYTREEQISVSKYYPWQPIRYWKEDSNNKIVSTMENVTNRFLPETVVVTLTGPPANQGSNTNNLLSIGTIPAANVAKYCGTGQFIPPTLTTQRVLVTYGSPNEDTGVVPLDTGVFDVNPAAGTITLDKSTNLSNGDSITIGRNPYYNVSWPGDKQYLKERFVKLSYRFRFEDNEYSLIAPFSQSIFIPESWGLLWSEDKAARSTIVEEFKNQVQQVGLQIDCPADLASFSELNSIYKVIEIDILYKEANDISLKLLDTINTETIASLTSTKILEYSYKSLKPIQTLPDNVLVRVFDKTPVKALTQETAGNRILYGNIVAQNAVPDSLNYNIQTSVKLKSDVTQVASKPYQQIEYPTHTLKENRNYQIGIVLCDKFGRQSDVILSSQDNFVTDGSFGDFGGSTIYHPYRTQDLMTYPISNTDPPIDMFSGETIKILFNNVIPNDIPKTGYPGLYQDPGGIALVVKTSGGTGWTANQSYRLSQNSTSGFGIDAEFLIATDSSGAAVINTSSVIISGSNYKLGETVTINDPNSAGVPLVITIKRIKDSNPLGWFSYKVVVKQTQQDYYNVYLPGVLNNGPQDGVSGQIENSNDRAYVTLIGENINKVPRDLQAVGPNQDLFSSEVLWWPRVENTDDPSTTGFTHLLLKQFYPSLNPDKVVRIGPPKPMGVSVGINGRKFNTFTGKDSAISPPIPGLGGTFGYNISPFYEEAAQGYNSPLKSGTALEALLINGSITAGDNYQAKIEAVDFNENSGNQIAEIRTQKRIGQISGNQGDTSTPADFQPNLTYDTPYLTVYETKPVDSNLDIYWETSTAGLISELNADITANDNVTPSGLQSLNFTLFENATPLSRVTDDFYPLTAGGVVINNINTSVTLISAINGSGFDETNKFETALQKNANNSFYMRSAAGAYWFFIQNSPQVENYTLTFQLVNGTASNILTVSPPNQLQNIDPYWYHPVGSTTDPGETLDLSNSGAITYPALYNSPTTTECPTWQSSGSPSYGLLTTLDGFNGSADPRLYPATFPQPNKIQMSWAIEDLQVYRTPSFGNVWVSVDTLDSSGWNPLFGQPWVSLIKNSTQSSPQQTEETLLYSTSVRGGNPYSNSPSGVFGSQYLVTLPGGPGSPPPTVPAQGTWTALSYSNNNTETNWGGVFPMLYRVKLRLQDANGSGSILTKYVEFRASPNRSACPEYFQGVIVGN